jgi:hypothetical protein
MHPNKRNEKSNKIAGLIHGKCFFFLLHCFTIL